MTRILIWPLAIIAVVLAALGRQGHFRAGQVHCASAGRARVL